MDMDIVEMGMVDTDIKYNLHIPPIPVFHIQLEDPSSPFGLVFTLEGFSSHYLNLI